MPLGSCTLCLSAVPDRSLFDRHAGRKRMVSNVTLYVSMPKGHGAQAGQCAGSTLCRYRAA
jgi:hypothetical protein